MDRLFVYGTLKRGEENAWRVAGAKSIERASARGRLFALPEGYPVLLEGEGGSVLGELLFFDDLSARLPSLDAFEGFDPERPDESLFIRAIVAVTRPSGATVEAFAYVMPGAREPWIVARGARRILSGHWSSRTHGLREDG